MAPATLLFGLSLPPRNDGAAVSEKSSTAGVETMADFLDGYIGVLDSREHTPGGARMSERCGEKFTAMLVDEHRRKQP